MRRFLAALLLLPWLAGSAPAQQFINAYSVSQPQDVLVTLLGYGTSTATVQATGGATFAAAFQVGDDGTNWISISGAPQPSGSATSTATADGYWLFPVAGHRFFRIHVTSVTGTEMFTFVGGPGSSPIVTTTPGGGNQPIVPGTTTTLDPDISSVTTGATAVNAFSAGHCKYGCYVLNPANATVNLCGRDTGTASGTQTNAGTVCAGPGQQLTFAPTLSAISVISSDSSHAFGGKGSQ